MRSLEQSDLYRQKVEWWLPRAGGEVNEDLVFNGYRVSVGEDEKTSGDEWTSGDGCTTT